MVRVFVSIINCAGVMQSTAKKRRRIHIPKRTKVVKKTIFQEYLEQIHRDWKHLKSSCEDPRFLRRMAINIKHLQHEARKAKVDNLCQFLVKTTLVRAADCYGEELPQQSELAELLKECGKHDLPFPALEESV